MRLSQFHPDEPPTPIELEAAQAREEDALFCVTVVRLLENGNLWRALRWTRKGCCFDETTVFPCKGKEYLSELQKYQLATPDELYVAKSTKPAVGGKEKRQVELHNMVEDASTVQFLVNWVKDIPVQLEVLKKIEMDGSKSEYGKFFDFWGMQDDGKYLNQKIILAPGHSSFYQLNYGYEKPIHVKQNIEGIVFMPGDYFYNVRLAAYKKKEEVFAEEIHICQPK